jgi:hypothetical protein
VTVTKTFLASALALTVLAWGAGVASAQEAPIPAGTWQFVPEESQPTSGRRWTRRSPT